jgi:endonuclease G
VPSAANEFPECTLLEIETPDGRSQLCSGVLVGKRLILSAAHCGNARRITAHLKCATIDDIRDGRAESIPAKAFRVHPDYRSSNHPAINDIMLVILAQDSSVSPVDICETKDLITAREVTLVGFGSASLNANSSTAGVKRKVEVPMTSIRHAIGEDIDREEASYGFESDSEFVAGREGFDTCQGDSGGPVYVIEEATGNRVVAGLTSRYALTNGREPANICGSGGIYTRIDFHLPWITRTAKQLLKA